MKINFNDASSYKSVYDLDVAHDKLKFKGPGWYLDEWECRLICTVMPDGSLNWDETVPEHVCHFTVYYWGVPFEKTLFSLQSIPKRADFRIIATLYEIAGSDGRHHTSQDHKHEIKLNESAIWVYTRDNEQIDCSFNLDRLLAEHRLDLDSKG